jgi:hypothetical protein
VKTLLPLITLIVNLQTYTFYDSKLQFYLQLSSNYEYLLNYLLHY